MRATENKARARGLSALCLAVAIMTPLSGCATAEDTPASCSDRYASKFHAWGAELASTIASQKKFFLTGCDSGEPRSIRIDSVGREALRNFEGKLGCGVLIEETLRCSYRGSDWAVYLEEGGDIISTLWTETPTN